MNTHKHSPKHKRFLTARYDEIMRLLHASLAEGKIPPSLIEEIEKLEKKLAENPPAGIEGKVYMLAADVLRDLRIELEKASKINEIFRSVAYGASLDLILGRGEKHGSKEEKIIEKPATKEYLPIKDEIHKVLVTFKTPVSRFVGVDMKVYGPFSEGDIAFIPLENAKVLRDREVVEVVEE